MIGKALNVVVDLDGDSPTDREEGFVWVTDPTLFDTDGGGTDDGTEIRRGTNPSNPSDD